ncbi:TPA: hypothetical protein PXS10_002131 [Yersinia enterocolitica]|uniref:Uncharacterized protein n=2 Tax=Yersinia TaxID=629 RepID=A0A386HJA0_9GAMM|nr:MULTISPECIES: hypothetical protein [Yersinia]CNH90934.1 Uncharacterised protein [Yersinia kristensenii]AKF36512.1 hypothetical protein FORC2_0365 [Yersinia enterocolitica]ALG46886.1 hypothetical protein LI89_19830 [Yersinia enterocolitica]AYD45474.1 hypothetical protein DXZ79_18305 [Yersinia rochesterensis]EKN5153357.1 hypothetical protein [Yersinia enterocolitica]
MSTKKVISLPEKKYFPLNRVEREIGIACDVEDLIHFAAIGEVELCVKINWQRYFDPDSIATDDIRIFSRYDYEKARKALTETDYTGHPELSYLEVAYETDITVFEEQIIYIGEPKDLIHIPVEIKGMFAVSSELFSFSEKALIDGGIFYEKTLKLPRANDFSVYDITSRSGGDGIKYTPTGISGLNYPVSINNLYITNVELERLISGKTHSVLAQDKCNDKPNHGNVERFAAKREQILMAAMYIQKEYPEKCKTYVDWAKQIDISAISFWPDTGKPPLEIDGIERLLSKVFDPKKWSGN